MAYGPNRTDLNIPKVNFSDQDYGTEVGQQQLQQVSQPPPADRSAREAAQGHDFPQLPNMGAPTANPREPITAGMDMGAGPGPESLMPMMNNRTPTQVDLERMRRALPTLEALADLPDTGETYKTYVLQLRGQARNV